MSKTAGRTGALPSAVIEMAAVPPNKKHTISARSIPSLDENIPAKITGIANIETSIRLQPAVTLSCKAQWLCEP